MNEKQACGGGQTARAGVQAGFPVAFSPTAKWKAKEAAARLAHLATVPPRRPTAVREQMSLQMARKDLMAIVTSPMV